MKRFWLVTFFAVIVTCIASGQQSSRTITGIQLGGHSSETCPVLVTGVMSASPAARAGVKSGDVLVAVDGTRVASVEEAVKLLFHSESESPLTLQLVRGVKTYTTTVQREKRSAGFARLGQKVLDSGMIVPLDATETEMRDKIKSLSKERFVDRVFPSHYPTNESLYYAGFEVLILKRPSQVVVLGIEDGPASHAGIHWGDTILSVDGVDPRNKSVSELERLFSSDKPATMTLKIERVDVRKTYAFELAQAAQVLRDNVTQLFHGHPMPLGIAEKYLPCFFDTSSTD